jgi:hypothetical protein
MKTLRFTVPLVLLLAPALFNASRADDDPYAEFRIPAHSWSSWQLGGGASGSSEQLYPFGAAIRQNALDGNLHTGFQRGYDSDRSQHYYQVTVVSQGLHRRQEVDRTFPRETSDDTFNDRAELLRLGGGLRRYPWQVPIGFQLAASGEASFDHGSFDRHRSTFVDVFHNRQDEDGSQDNNQQILGGVFSMGLGRVRDATSVYRAQVLEQRLLRTGALKGPLSRGALDRLAALFSIQSDFLSAHDLPDKYFWREVERILKEDGELAGESLDAYSVLRALDPHINIYLSRQVGFFVGPSIAAVETWRYSKFNAHRLSRFYQGDSLLANTEQSVGGHSSQRFDRTQVGAVIEYHRPIGMRWQIDAGSSAYYTRLDHQLFGGSSASINYVIADRWYAGARVGHSLSEGHLDQNGEVPRWLVRYDGFLSYWLEDSWSVDLSVVGSQQNQGAEFERAAGFSLGFTYRIAGTLNAPGVIEPQRLSPPRD